MIWLVAIIGSMTGFLFGYDEGIIAGSLELVQQHFQFSHTSVGVMAASLPFGALIGSMLTGAFIASKLSRYVGRRTILFLVGFLFFIGAIGTAIAHVKEILIISRLLIGFAIGLAAITTPMYLAEAAPKRSRGAIVSMYQLAITIGICSAYAVNYYLITEQAWRMMFASSIIPAILLIIGLCFLPESPRYLMSIGDKDKAKFVLKKLRNNKIIDSELEEIQQAILEEPREKNWKLAFKKPLLPVLSLGMVLFCLQQLSGINVIIYFAPQIFKNLGFTKDIGHVLATLGIGGVNVIITVFALFFIDRIGRRKLLLFGFFGTSLSLTVLSLYTYFQLPGLAYIAIISLSFYIISFAISIGPIPHLAMSEIFPLHIRGIGMGISSMSNWSFNTLTVFSFPLLQAYLGLEATFGFYAVMCVLGYIYTYFKMPETKHLSLEEIEQHLLAGKPLKEIGKASEVSKINTLQPGLSNANGL